MAIYENPDSRKRVAGDLTDGTKFRYAEVEEVFNAALCMDAIDGPGAFRASQPPGMIIVLARAEALYGLTVEQALPKWLNMPRTAYNAWSERPRVAWHGRVLA